MSVMLFVAAFLLAACVMLPNRIDRLINAASVAVCVAVAFWVSPTKAEATKPQVMAAANLSPAEQSAAYWAGRIYQQTLEEVAKK